jgi:type II secretory pathway pseudopilin PulG
MIELLVVMFIIAMLLVIGVPAALRFRTLAKINSCRVTVNIIDKAVSMYHTQHKRYPDVLEMTARLIGVSYRFDAQQDKPVEVDDGHPGPGYRLQPRGRVYGPWNGVDKLIRTGEYDEDSGASAPGAGQTSARIHFIDSFGNPIWYCPFKRPTETSAPTYTDSEFDKDDSEPGVGITSIADYAKDALGRFYRRDYILMSQSANSKWGLIRGTNSSSGSSSANILPTDDVTNFTKD